MEFDFNTPISKDITLNALYNESSINPNEVTFENIRLAMQTGNPKEIFPVGVSVADVWNGTNQFGWVLVHYGEATLTDGTKSQGAFFMSDKCLYEGARSTISTGYGNSNLYALVQEGGGFYRYFSNMAKSYATKISVPYRNPNNGIESVNAQFWSADATEVNQVYTAPSLPNEDIWEWFDVDSTTANIRRVHPLYNNAQIYCWLRSWDSGSQFLAIHPAGNVTAVAYSSSQASALCFFMPAYKETN